MQLTSTDSERRAFLPDVGAARDAREFVLGSSLVAGCETADIALALSELVSNAVLHARTALTVLIQRWPAKVRITVSDGSASPPRPQSVDATSVTGRGLRIVDQISTSWGADITSSGKDVWFELGCRDER